MKQIILGGGCFWCTEAAFQLVEGVTEVLPGYAGGLTDNPSYEEVCGGGTNHAEVVHVEYDETKVGLDEILRVFFKVHDPTTPNRQGADVGTQYRSFISYRDDADLPVIEQALDAAEETYGTKPVTEVQKGAVFYPAEEEHVNYYRNNPSRAYCQIVIAPKLEKLQKEE